MSDTSAEINPMLNFLQSFNATTSSSPGARGLLTDHDELCRDDDLDDDSPLSHILHAAVPHTFQHFGQIMKAKKSFSAQTAAEFDAFCSLMSPDDCVLMLFVTILETRDLILANKKADKWMISSELKDSAHIYSQAFILSPTTVAYRGDAPKHIMAAMRSLNIGDMPPDKEVVRLDMLHKLIVKFLTDCCNTLKEKIKNSLAVDSSTRNIADLTHAVISNTLIQPTLQHYMWMAFLHWCYVKYANKVQDDGWWLKVDESLENFCTELKDELKISQAFNSLYKQAFTVLH
ncbi:hypothetical protein K443DRAFT_13657 [Laccaria amethystina LaAM-08-1]|uniref:Uncharacterized protein n=1 Tax=Laccaria amethystina LaAM-08-1 TaxID=1095629 RepID=A0A0C9WNY0_9AGAR|nr:hypothetical protein K443DRAFT_13657 [Laccaria amethystina LaAM-08-1]